MDWLKTLSSYLAKLYNLQIIMCTVHLLGGIQCMYFSFRPNKKISVFWVTGLEILGGVGTLFFFLEKK